MTLTLFANTDRERLNSLARDGALLVVPIGATEQHGPHLPTGTDAMTVFDIASAAADQVDRHVVVAPCLPYGSSDHHLSFGATLSVSTETYLRLLVDLGASAVQSGFRIVMFINGHGGNHELARLAVRDLALRYPHAAFAAGSWWVMAGPAIEQISSGVNVPGHAGAFETSLMLAAYPQLLGARPAGEDDGVTQQLARGRSGTRWEHAPRWSESNGWTDSPNSARAELGAAMFAAAAASVAAEILAFTDQYKPKEFAR